MCCGNSDGTKRVTSSTLGFTVVGPDGSRVGEPFWNHIEASARATELGAGFHVVTEVVVLQP